jgi:hypothetical protein
MFQSARGTSRYRHGRLQNAAGSVERAEQVAGHRKPAALDPGKIKRRSSGLIYPPMYRRSFKVRINLLLNAHELSGPLQIVQALAETAVRHGDSVGAG